jgi:mannose-6-phosphate isomerase-like protein (cupin superfamily)
MCAASYIFDSTVRSADSVAIITRPASSPPPDSDSLTESPPMTTAITPNVAAHAALAPLASRLVDTDALAWEPTRYPGIEVKTLLFDRASGLVSALMRMAPGAVLPDHEHVQIEQTWILEGHLIDKSGPDEGIECKAGQFIWRPAGSRHSAWSPRGALTLAFFQIPNRFFEPDGREADMGGADWRGLWGELHEGRNAPSEHAAAPV